MSDTPKKKPVTRRQHWLPRTYLREFTTNKKLHAYKFTPTDKRNFLNLSKHEEVTPRGVAHSYNFYEVEGLPVNAIEDVLGFLEDVYRTIYDTKISKQLPLTETEHAKLATFVSVLQHRTTAGKDHINDFIDRVIKMGKQVAIAHDSPEAAARHEEKWNAFRQEAFTEFIIASLDVDVWNALDFCFLVIPDSIHLEFITSDNPVSLVDFARDNSFYGLHPWAKTAESVVPLGPKIALFGNRVGITGYKEIDYNFIRDINLRTISSSRALVVSRTELDPGEIELILQRHRSQSLLVKFVSMPDGRADAMIAAQEAAEKITEQNNPESTH